ncbi:MAG TPA: LipL32 family surface lipoprotein [Bacteroidales bacterium]|nr:LipL32 family surface lipoprotein [Bacteroidales bacterium]HPS15855.1 LipL32 family surface lipoprotein [Bacteroidales bacterium]
MKIKIITFLLLIFTFQTQAQRLNVFGAELGKQKRNGQDLRYPYADTKCYFGFIDSTWQVSDTAGGKNFYYLYFNLPQETAEIGVRLMSPVSPVMFPDKGDIVEEGYYEYRKANKNWFDPWIALEHYFSINDTAKIDSTKKEWIMLGSNDDNDELFAQPSGKKNNSLFRIISDTLQPYKTLSSGIYRIVISSMKDEKISGSFILQIGSATKLNGIKIKKKFIEIEN